MFFVDYDNFKQALTYSKTRHPDFNKLPGFLFQKINNLLEWTKYNPRLIRTYVYSGEYSKNLSTKIKDKLNRNKHDKAEIDKYLSKIKEETVIQSQCFQRLKLCHFVELKLKPLQFSRQEMKVFQKGTDVQLAVDLVHHAYQDNFDVATVCSGDVDLLESIRLIKNLGKKVVLVAHPNNLAYDMRKDCDFFYNLAKLKEEERKSISFELPEITNQQNISVKEGKES